MMIDAIRFSPQVGQDTLVKAILTPSNDLSATLYPHATLHSQGISAGAVVTLMTRYARVLEPQGSLHFIAYQELQVQECDLPQEPSLQMRFRNQAQPKVGKAEVEMNNHY